MTLRHWVFAAIALSVVAAKPLAAQRSEITVVGGLVQSPDVEFDRVLRSGSFGPTLYVRQRGVRESGAAFGIAATVAIRGHVFGEVGVMHHGVERAISQTGLGDESGPFLITNRYKGSVTSFWAGPSYRFVDRERVAASLVVAPTVLVMRGAAFEGSQVFQNAPRSSAAIGTMVGVRGRVWLTERVGVQLSLDDVLWTFPLTPDINDGTPFAPLSSRSTPLQHDLRVHVGASWRLR